MRLTGRLFSLVGFLAWLKQVNIRPWIYLSSGLLGKGMYTGEPSLASFLYDFLSG